VLIFDPADAYRSSVWIIEVIAIVISSPRLAVGLVLVLDNSALQAQQIASDIYVASALQARATSVCHFGAMCFSPIECESLCALNPQTGERQFRLT
jgi:NO-binding membrane sensor protein with MHYT domain